MSDAQEALDDETERALAEALVAAVQPRELDPKRHASILDAALTARPEDADPLVTSTPHERAAASRLAGALEQDATDPDAALLRSLRAIAPGPSPSESGAASERALRRAFEQAPVQAARSNVVFAWFGGAAAVAAAAAAVLLVVSTPAPDRPAHSRAAFAQSRSVAPLFSAQLADGAELSASARIDRIASVRARELRDNRYLAWGVR